MADWSDLSADLAAAVARRLTVLGDYLRFAAACTAWRSAATAARPSLLLPYLIIPDAGTDNHRTLLPLAGGCGHRITLPENDWRYFSSSNGWLIVANLDSEIFLYNPLSGSRVELPGLTGFREVRDVTFGRPCKGREKEEGLVFHVEDHGWNWTPVFRREMSNILMRDKFLHRGCISSGDVDCCVIMLIYGGVSELAFARPGDKAWIHVEIPSDCLTCFQNVVYHQGKFYAVSHHGAVVVIEIVPSTSKSECKYEYKVANFAPPLDPYYYGSKYLVFIPSGGLILLARNHVLTLKKKIPYKTVELNAFKLVYEKNGQSRWTELDDCLPDCTMFIGHNSSFAIPSSEASQVCQNNCIYFTDDSREYYYKHPRGGHDNGIYFLKDKSFQPLYRTRTKGLRRSSHLE